MLSRLAPPHIGVGDDAQYLRSEVEKVRRYLVRHSHLSDDQALDVYVVSPSDLPSAIGGLAPSPSPNRYRFVSLSEVGRRLGIAEAESLRWADRLFVALVTQRIPRHQYAPACETRSYTLHRVRSGLRALALLVFAGGLLGAGFEVADAYDAGRFAQSLRAQVDLYRKRYEEARTRLPPAPFEAPLLESAVATLESLRDARNAPDAVLLAVSQGLEPHPAVQLESIGWSTGAEHRYPGPPADRSSSAPDSGERRIPGSSAHSSLLPVDLQGRIEPFDGDYRRALEQVSVLADSLREVSGVVEVEVLSLPLEIGSGASLHGDAGARGNAAEAPFSLRVLWNGHVRS